MFRGMYDCVGACQGMYSISDSDSWVRSVSVENLINTTYSKNQVDIFSNMFQKIYFLLP